MPTGRWMSVDYGLDVAQHQLGWDEILRRARLAEDAGLSHVWVFDHFRPLYGDPDGPCLEAWTLLAALAASTERVRLGALVTGATYRHPSVLAAEAVTVDHVSAGRLEVGLGAGWFEDEHRQFGIDFPDVGARIDRLEETVTALRRLMTEDDVDLDGAFVQLRSATYRPRPLQRPHPPIWIGAAGRKVTIPLTARIADGWHCSDPLPEVAEKARILDEHAERAGRDPRGIQRASNIDISAPWDEVRRNAEGLSSAGFDQAVVQWPSEGWPRVETFVEEVLAELP